LPRWRAREDITDDLWSEYAGTCRFPLHSFTMQVMTRMYVSSVEFKGEIE